MTTTQPHFPKFSLRPKFRSTDNMNRPVAVFDNKPEFHNFQHMLTKQGAKFRTSAKKKSKSRAASWSITLDSPLGDLV